ncbi:MAG: precorrin-3B C(17)-methyltransferase [Proteobacteria bacterium]|nr:precorrin-3B C(17)-methyltransferase [Pseudomonadota bacterium]
MRIKGKIFVVGCGALTRGTLTGDAVSALERSQIIVGYKSYVDEIKKILPEKEYYQTGMKKEVERVTEAINFALGGKSVSLICSGDAGIYGMAGLLLELLDKNEIDIEYEIIPGLPALVICSAVLGAPLMNDFGVISFSNLLTNERLIEKRLRALLDGGLVVVIYNPVSKGRKELFDRLWDIILEERETNFGGYVKRGGKEGQEWGLGRVFDLPADKFDMNTLIIIGNEFTDIIKGRLITRRGYHL